MRMAQGRFQDFHFGEAQKITCMCEHAHQEREAQNPDKGWGPGPA